MVLGGLRFAGLAGGCTSSAWNAPGTTGPHYYFFSPSPFISPPVDRGGTLCLSHILGKAHDCRWHDQDN
jgi:hypothetical protein